MRHVALLLTLLSTVCASKPPPETTDQPFDSSAFTSSFTDVVDDFKARAVSAVTDEVSSYMDKIGVTAVVHDVIDSKLGQFLNKTALALDEMIDYFNEADIETRLEHAVEGVASKIGLSLGSLGGGDSGTSSTGAEPSSAGSRIGDVVLATVGLSVSPSLSMGSVKGESLSLSASAGFHFQAGVALSSPTDFVLALGGSASMGFAGTAAEGSGDGNTTSSSERFLREAASVLSSSGNGASSVWGKLDKILDATIAIDFAKTTDSISGFAYKVSVVLPSFKAIKELHVYLSHPNWGCLASNPASMMDPTVVGWGVTLYSGHPSGLVEGAKGLWGELKDSWEEMAALKGTWNAEWGSGRLMIGDGITVATTGPAPSFSQSACTSTTQRSATATSTSDVSGAVSKLVDVIKLVSPMILEGKFVTSFCMGSCHDVPLNTLKTVSGTATLEITEDHDGADVALWVPGLTFGGIGYVVASGLPNSVASVFTKLLSPIAALGLGDTTATFTVTKTGLSVSVVGSPVFPETSTSGFQQVAEGLSEIVFGVTASMSYSGDVAFEVDVATPPSGLDKVFALTDVTEKMGFTLFTKVEVKPEPILDLGVELPVRLCVEKCSSSAPRYLYLAGSLSLKVSASAQLVDGQVKMDGWWTKVLEIPFANIGDVILGIGMDLKVELPTKLEVGGAICLGKSSDCLGHTGTRIEGRAYVGVSATEPDSNYFTAMINQITIAQIFALIEEFAPPLSRVQIPAKLGASGIYPFDKTAAATCEEQRRAAVQGGSTPQEVDMDCFAYASFNAGTEDKTLTFRSGNLVVPVGIAFAGRLDFFGWEIAVKVMVSETAFEIDAEMDKVDLRMGGQVIMQIGKYLTASHDDVVGGARFHVAATVDPATALVGIYGAFRIPVLRSYGELQVTLNADIFRFEGDMHLFDGALTAHALVQWNWDMSYFSAALSDMNFLYVVKMESVRFTFDPTKEYAEFAAKVSVLALVKVDTQLTVKGSNIAFVASAELTPLLTMVVSGTAVLANPFLSSSFTLRVSVQAGELAKKIAAAVNDGLRKTAAAMQVAIGAVGDTMKKAYTEITEQFNGALNAIKDEAGKILSGVEDFANDVESALGSVPGLSDAFKIGEAVGKGDWNEFGKLTLDSLGLGSSSHSIEPTGKDNKYGCKMLHQVWRECHGAWIFESCSSKVSAAFPDSGCMKAVGKAANVVKKAAEAVKAAKKASTVAAQENAGLLSTLKGATMPEPSVDLLNYEVSPSASMPVSTPARVQFHTLEQGGFSKGQTAVTHNVWVDLSSATALQASLDKAAANVASASMGTVLKGQGKVESYLTDQGASGQYTAPVLGAAAGFTAHCTTLAAKTMSQKPVTTSIDARCRDGARVVAADLSDTAPYVNGCGAYNRQVTWIAYDAAKCNGQSAPVVQKIQVTPGTAHFTDFPADATVNFGDVYTPAMTGTPQGSTECGEHVTVSYTDQDPIQHDGDDHWVVQRTWTAKLTLTAQQCANTPVGETKVQMIKLMGGGPSELGAVKYFGATSAMPSLQDGVSLFRMGRVGGGYVGASTVNGSVAYTTEADDLSLWSLCKMADSLYTMRNVKLGCHLGRSGANAVCSTAVTTDTHEWNFQVSPPKTIDNVVNMNFMSITYQSQCLAVSTTQGLMGACTDDSADFYIEPAGTAPQRMC